MENGVVDVEDSGRVSEFGGVPVVMGGEDRRFGEAVDSEDVGFDGWISG